MTEIGNEDLVGLGAHLAHPFAREARAHADQGAAQLRGRGFDLDAVARQRLGGLLGRLLGGGPAALLGLQLCLFALFARVSAQTAGLLPRRPGLDKALNWMTLEKGLLTGLAVALCGLAWSAAAFWEWRETGFGPLDPRVVMRDTIPATTLMVGGVELALASFLLSVLRLKEAA